MNKRKLYSWPLRKKMSDYNTCFGVEMVTSRYHAKNERSTKKLKT